MVYIFVIIGDILGWYIIDSGFFYVEHLTETTWWLAGELIVLLILSICLVWIGIVGLIWMGLKTKVWFFFYLFIIFPFNFSN